MSNNVRQIVLDTETTGFHARGGDRIVEVGCVEIINRKITKNNFHRYVNPERDSDPGALQVHGLTTEFLSDKPKFEDIARELVEFVKGAEIIIHNANFDVSFLDAELERAQLGPFSSYVNNVVDTLVIAKELHPGKRNSLDALCDRYGISNAHRQLHGALLDSELLADVYLAMSRGQNSLAIDVSEAVVEHNQKSTSETVQTVQKVLVRLADAAELEAHQQIIAALTKSGKCVWPADQ